MDDFAIKLSGFRTISEQLVKLDLLSSLKILQCCNVSSDALGCLVFEEEGISFDGNQGIKDQQLALQWVNKNIEGFGGNKSQVRIAYYTKSVNENKW